MLNGDRGVLSVGNQFARSSGIAAEPLKDGEVIRAGTHDSGGRPPNQFGNKSERFVQRRGRAEDTRIRRDPEQPRQHQNRERERFRAIRQPGEPLRIAGMFGGRIRSMGVQEHVDVGEQHVAGLSRQP